MCIVAAVLWRWEASVCASLCLSWYFDTYFCFGIKKQDVSKRQQQPRGPFGFCLFMAAEWLTVEKSGKKKLSVTHQNIGKTNSPSQSSHKEVDIGKNTDTSFCSSILTDLQLHLHTWVCTQCSLSSVKQSVLIHSSFPRLRSPAFICLPTKCY